MADRLLLGRALRTNTVSWTNITAGSEVLLIPDFPDTVRKGTADAATGTANVTDLKDAAGDALDLEHNFVQVGDNITIDFAGTFTTKEIATITGKTTLTVASNWAATVADGDMWLRDSTPGRSPQYVVLGYELHSSVKAKYTFEAEDGTDVGAPVWLGVDGHKESKLWFPVTAGKRLRLLQSAAGAGSITINYRVQEYAPTNAVG